MIVRNSARCLDCKQEIESKGVHDFVSCKCGNIHVDGGQYYLKRGYKKKDRWVDTSFSVEPGDKLRVKTAHRIFGVAKSAEAGIVELTLDPSIDFPMFKGDVGPVPYTSLELEADTPCECVWCEARHCHGRIGP